MIFFYQPSFWVSKKKCRFVFGQKFQKITLILFLPFLKPLFFLSFINFCFWICFFMHDLQKHFAIFCVSYLFFGKYLVSLCFCPPKKNSKKVIDSLYFFSLLLLDRARMRALLTIAACRDVVERVKSVCIQLSCISAAEHPLHHAMSHFFSSFLFFLWKHHVKKCYVNVFLCPFVLFPIFWTLFWLLCFDCSSKSKTSWQKIHFFLFSPPCFYSHVSCPFCLSLCFCQGDLIAEDKTRHQEKWVKPMVGMVNKVWKRGLLLACFSAWPKVWVDGPESTRENALADDFLARLGSNSVFLVIEWLVCALESPRYTRKWMLIIISLCFLSLHFYSLYVYPPSSTLGKKVTGKIGQLEAVRLNLEDSMVCVEDQRKIVLENKHSWKSNWTAWKKETSKLTDTVTAALVICEEHMRDNHATRLGRRINPTILQERNCQITGATKMHPCNVLEWK